MKSVKALSLVGAAVVTALCNLAAAEASEVNVYSARQEELIKPLLDKFSAQTGIKVNLITGKPDELISRMASEGRNSPADLLISTDVGRLYRAKQQGVLQAITSDVLSSTIPAEMRDPSGQWFGLTMRARPILYVPGKVDPKDLSTYEALTSPQWKGRICIRSSDNIYNQSMTASLIAHDGAEKAESWAKGLVANFAMPPKGGDRDQIKAAAAGVCDIAIANTYYLGGMLADAKEKAAAEKVKVFWPNQADRGAHINISGAGIAKYAPNKTEAIQLLEYMTTADAQQWYAETNHEYPVRAGVKASAILQGFGEFKADQLQLDKLGELNAEAIRVMDRAGWK
ncbi:MAG: Fe(3+) ABC transporter substrate-binding protein [Gammaproteobacteria bacterium]|nr:Fe(3+) ABC transporter substrate-binding protein [Gammaproteobacteria bacterium]MBU1554874.1 Fe(3+) ABC transporter substrate-binding protein [Gammaproteobacteria bacterium]MBU2070987.1 Fe(3+) ABC transporter substrate-binding protein [Gammaproteobacteria bacterium]MBU2183813.1 Fe(3+) ABC transporter substrate-binding protein [Gammaproteobacteria bacterium]MBU2206488.1 Fe(3+) ABC transporter substrate-binding protein [Gammaproteobacteria bacterium]